MRKQLENLSSWEKGVIKWIRRTRPTIYTVLRHVSNSGMFRLIDVYAIKKGKPLYLSGLVANITSFSRDKNRQGLRIRGCGMDMGFHVVYCFSRRVFPTGFKYRKNEHHRNGDPSKRDKDGGYALRQEWL